MTLDPNLTSQAAAMSGSSKFVTSPQAADPDPSKPNSGLQPCHPVDPVTNQPICLNPVDQEIETANDETIRAVTRQMNPPKESTILDQINETLAKEIQRSLGTLLEEEKAADLRSGKARVVLNPSLNDPRNATGDPHVRDSRKPHGPTAMATSGPMEIRSAVNPSGQFPPSADPSVASPPPSQPSAEVSVVPPEQATRLLDPTLQARALQNTLGFIGMRLEVLPDSSRHQMADLLMWIMESDMESGVTETMFKEIKSVSRSVWADQKITNMILCLRACEAASRFFLGPLGVQ